MSRVVRLKTFRGYVDVCVDKFVEAYRSQMRNDELAESFGIVKSRVCELGKLLGLPPRSEHLPRLGAAAASARHDDPTPEQIAERAAIERSRWSPEEEARRYVGPRPGAVQVLSYSSHSSRTRSHVTFREAPYGF